MTKEYYNLLVNKLINYENQYYNEDNSTVSDAEFDSLLKILYKFEKAHPNWKRSDSPTNRVMGQTTKNLKEVTHKIPLLSLGKAMDFDELKKELYRMYKLGVKDFFVECKHDGLACKLIYENYKLVLGATRGNGKVGNDVTLTCLQIPSIPKKIAEQNLEVRGEIFLTKSGLTAINKYIANTKGQEKKNVRNTASGLLREENPDPEKSKYLLFSGYMALTDDDSHSESMKHIKNLGFYTTNDFVKTKNFHIDDFNICFDRICKFINEIYELRDSLDFDIDGMVIKANKKVDQAKLGNKETVPNWAIAYKFPQVEKVTILRSVRWDIGDKGNLTPVAFFDTVNICGADINNATLHNIEEINRLNLKIGDKITVTRRGDVIPKVVKSHIDLRDGTETSIEIPTNCPVCNEPLTRQDVYIRCDNNNCAARISGKLLDFLNKLEVKDVGQTIIKALVNLKKLKTFGDLYRLKESDIVVIERQGEVSAKKIVSRIQDSKSASIDKVIAGLGIPNIGVTTGNVLAKTFKTLENFKQAKYEQLICISDIGETTAYNIINWIKKNQDVLQDLIDLNIGKQIEMKSGNLNNKTFAFTGTLSSPRKTMQNFIEENGGINSSIKKGLNYLLIGEGAKEEKINKAKNYGAKIISEKEFFNMIK